MSEQRYSILMHTPLGKKHGMITARKTANRLSGTFDILEHSRPFDGEINSAGECQISGSIVTLLRTFSYTAAGKIDENAIHLFLKGDRDTYEIIGAACTKKEDILE